MQGGNSPVSSEVLLILAQTDAQRDIAGRASIPILLEGPLGIMVRDAYRVLRMSFGMTGASAPSRGAACGAPYVGAPSWLRLL